ncbi:MAG: hypothetical protein ACOYMY_01105 [Prochlorococcaceae cyanobacterium]
MSSLVLSLGLSALVLLLLRGVLDLALRLLEHLQGCGLQALQERLHDDLMLRQVRWREQELLLEQQAARRRRHEPMVAVIDLEGSRRRLSPEEVTAFRRRCCEELELPEGCDWSSIRRFWRRGSLHWHPDRGGDPGQWLRKRRAYEALDLLRHRGH